MSVGFAGPDHVQDHACHLVGPAFGPHGVEQVGCTAWAAASVRWAAISRRLGSSGRAGWPWRTGSDLDQRAVLVAEQVLDLDALKVDDAGHRRIGLVAGQAQGAVGVVAQLSASHTWYAVDSPGPLE